MTVPRIFYFCYDHQRPSGGQKQMYRHIDILNRDGYQAFALHVQKGFRLTWFDNETRVICFDDMKKIYDPLKDLIVLPEDLGEKILSFPGKKIIFNQGAYLGFYCMGLQSPKTYPYLHSDIRAVIVVSDHNRDYLSFAYPDAKIYRVYNGFESKKYPYRPIDTKRNIISCLPSNNPVDMSQVYHILMSRAHQGINRLRDYKWIFIENMPEQAVARTLGDSLVFIFLSTEEGFGGMPLEAMLSGSLVVAYMGGPLTEYLNSDNSFPSPKGDIMDVVKNIEKVVALFDDENNALSQVSQKAMETASRYSMEREKESVLETWKVIIGGN